MELLLDVEEVLEVTTSVSQEAEKLTVTTRWMEEVLEESR